MSFPDGSDAARTEGVRAAFAKAQAREPMLASAPLFVPPAARAVFEAWVGVLAALRDAVFERSEARVATLKTAWWAEELEGVARGAARHPLTRTLVSRRGDWGRVADALHDVVPDPAPPTDGEAALGALAPLARAVVGLEASVFGLGDADEAMARALAVHWLRHRLEQGPEAPDHARIPLALFARHGLRREQWATAAGAALRQDWAAWLGAALPPDPVQPWAYPRRLALWSDREALRRLACGEWPPSDRRGGRFAMVWRAWRLARASALGTVADLTSDPPRPT
jgi:hypothetical protein